MKHLSLCAVTTAVLFIAALAPKAAIAGTTGMLSGIAYDCGPKFACALPTGRAPYAEIHVTSMTGQSIAYADTVADANGFFSFVSLEPGRYFVSANRKGRDYDCAAFTNIWADQMTIVSVAVSKAHVLGHCSRVFKPAGFVPTWDFDAHGAIDH